MFIVHRLSLVESKLDLRRIFRLPCFLADADEVASGTADQTNTETDGFPGGIIGFKLDWWQNSC